jgi:hypothetical protein
VDSTASLRGGAPGIEWAKPSRRLRALAAALALALAVLTAVIVSLAWKRVPSPRPARPPVEVKLIGAPSPAPEHARPSAPGAPSMPR